MSKRKLEPTVEDETLDETDYLSFVCLGGGNEVGRSCHIIQYKGKTVMLDAGVHPAYEGLASLPFYDEFDLSTVDILLISHFHLDHAASLPYVLTKTNFRGRVFMTHPTKAIYKWLISDSVRVSNTQPSSTTQLYTESEHISSFSQISAIDYYQTLHHSSISITPFPAGHVLGAAMFLVEIAGLKILFTGDYSREDDRHLVSATLPKNIKPHVLITESTYGTASHMPRPEKEAKLLQLITGILDRGGRVLMPVFALGRAQELLLILEEYWENHERYQNYPIYYASSLARRCMTVYQTYIHAMNDNIKTLFRSRMAAIGSDFATGGGGGPSGGNTGGGGGAGHRDSISGGNSGKMVSAGGRNPFEMRWVRSLKNLDRFEDVGGCVMLASPGMMQNGVSRELLEKWCPDPRNGVIITGYSVEGTLAKSIMNEPNEIPAIMTSRGAGGGGRRDDNDRVMVPRRCAVHELSFAAHVDYGQNSSFIEEVGAKVVILVHGEQNNMGRLKSALLSKNSERKEKIKIYNPKNCEELRIPFKGEKIANVVGKLAKGPPKREDQLLLANKSNGDQFITGVLVQNDFKLSLMAPQDLREYAGLTTTVITCRQKVPMSTAGVGLIRWCLEGMFGGVTEITNDDAAEDIKNKLKIGDNENSKSSDDANDEKAERDGKARVKEEEASSEMDVNTDVEATEATKGKKSNTRQNGSEHQSFRVMGCVDVHCRDGFVELEWEGNVLNDGIADAVLAILLSVESSPASIKQSSKMHPHSHSHQRNPHAYVTSEERLERILMFLQAQFGDTVTPLPTSDEAAKHGAPFPGVQIKIDDHVATVRFDTETLEVDCKFEALRARIKAVVERAVETITPLAGLMI